MASMSREKRARRYLEASMHAGYTGLAAEHRQAYEDQMRSHERAYPGVREHALAGADKDFDKPLEAGVREHQSHLREQHGMSHAQVLEARKRLRDGETGGGSSSRIPARARRPALRRARAGTVSALSAGAGVISGHPAGGNLGLQIVGVVLILVLVYLLVAGKGTKAVAGIGSAVTSGVRWFVAPVDPVAELKSSLGFQEAAQTTGAEGGPSSAASGAEAGPPSSAPAPPPASAAIAAVKKANTLSSLPPPSLLKADLKLRAAARKLVAAGKETAGQAVAREEALIPRGKYPAFYGGAK